MLQKYFIIELKRIFKKQTLRNLKYISSALLCFSFTGCVADKGFVDFVAIKKITSFQKAEVPAAIRKHYASVTEGKFTLPAIDIETIDPQFWRKEIYFPSVYPVGTIVVDSAKRQLFLIEPDNKAIRYGVGVGKPGLALTGSAIIGAKLKWPHWSPTKDMMARDPAIYGNMQQGMDAGVDNPLGARAMYLYKDGKDTHFRIHGSYEAWSIGKAMSSGCIRMLNQDVIDLYNRVKVGTRVVIVENGVPTRDRLISNPDNINKNDDSTTKLDAKKDTDAGVKITNPIAKKAPKKIATPSLDKEGKSENGQDKKNQKSVTVKNSLLEPVKKNKTFGFL